MGKPRIRRAHFANIFWRSSTSSEPNHCSLPYTKAHIHYNSYKNKCHYSIIGHTYKVMGNSEREREGHFFGKFLMYWSDLTCCLRLSDSQDDAHDEGDGDDAAAAAHLLALQRFLIRQEKLHTRMSPISWCRCRCRWWFFSPHRRASPPPPPPPPYQTLLTFYKTTFRLAGMTLGASDWRKIHANWNEVLFLVFCRISCTMLLLVIGSLLLGGLMMRVFYVVWNTGKPCPDIYGKKASLQTLVVLGSGEIHGNHVALSCYEVFWTNMNCWPSAISSSFSTSF